MMAVRSASVIVPLYRQADHVEQILTEYLAVLGRAPVPCELIAVLNGPEDGSLEICRRLAALTPSLRVIVSAHQGWGSAVTTGIASATGDLICYTNSARTTADDLGLFIGYGVANPGTVIKAVRKLRDGWQRRVGSLLFNLECRALFDLIYWDVNGTPKVFPRTFDRLVALSRDDDLIDLEFAVVTQRARYPMLEVPIFSSSRRGGRSTTNYMSALKLLWRAFVMSREWNAAHGRQER